MSKSWSNRTRKRHGKSKTKDHKSRSKWASRNGGVRLRTLNVDITEFQEAKGEALPVTEEPKEHKKTRRKSERRAQRKAPRRPPLAPKKKKKPPAIFWKRKGLYDQLSTKELNDRYEFYWRQAQFSALMLRFGNRSGSQMFRAFNDELKWINLYLQEFRVDPSRRNTEEA